MTEHSRKLSQADKPVRIAIAGPVLTDELRKRGLKTLDVDMDSYILRWAAFRGWDEFYPPQSEVAQ